MSQLNISNIKNKRGDFGPVLVGYSTVSGDLNVTGDLTANLFTGDGSGLTNVTGIAQTANIKADTITVTGVVTATTFDGNVTGNADTATTATNAENIELVDESFETTCYVVYTTAATGNQEPKTGSNLTFNSSNGTLTATSFSGNLTGDVTGNADTATSSTSATTATNANNVNLADEGSDTTCFPTFATNSSGNQALKTDASALTYNASTGQLTAVDLNATSDINLKKDIEVITDATGLIKQLNGVRFTWKENDRKSLGVIAQEVEELLPELISERTDTGTKSVNYNGLVGVLIEAVKELSARVDELEKR